MQSAHMQNLCFVLNKYCDIMMINDTIKSMNSFWYGYEEIMYRKERKKELKVNMKVFIGSNWKDLEEGWLVNEVKVRK